MLKLHTKLEDKLLDLESHSRCKNIKIYGVLEGSEKESTTMISFVENLICKGLDLTNDMPDLQIESSVPDPLPCQAARETRRRNQNLRYYGGGIRGPAEKRLHRDNHHTSGDTHGAGSAAVLEESG